MKISLIIDVLQSVVRSAYYNCSSNQVYPYSKNNNTSLYTRLCILFVMLIVHLHSTSVDLSMSQGLFA